MSTKTCQVLCITAGILAVVAGILISFQAGVLPLAVGIPCLLSGVLGIASAAAFSKNSRAAGGFIIAAAVCSFVCLNLVSMAAFMVARSYAFPLVQTA